MTEPKWIRDDVVRAIHRRQIAEHGGLDGVRDEGLLESALVKPKSLYHYNDPKPGIVAMTAAYAYGIARNHAFVDGNKRTAFVVCRRFLVLNDKELNATAAEKYMSFMKLAAGELSEEELAAWIAANIG
jgi:death on curing protein